MFAANANMPHVTSPEYNSRIIYQGSQLQSSSTAGNFHESSMGYYNYPDMQSYPGEFQSTGVPMAVGGPRSNTMDDRSSSNYPNLSTSRNPYPNSVTSSHEYYALENMDNRERYTCQQSVSQGQASARRINRSPLENSAARKNRSWTDAVFASMDREAESILELVNEDAMELERIAATIKQDCKSPNSTDTFLSNEFGPISLPSVGAMNDITYSRWSRPQFLDPSQRRKRSPRSDQPYMPDDYILSNDFQTFSLDSPPGQDYRFGDLYGLSNPVGHFGSNPNLGAYVRNSYAHQHSFLNDLQTYHGASPYAAYRQNFTSDNMRPAGEVMLGETPRSYYKPCPKDRTSRMRSKLSDAQDELKKIGEGSNSKSKHKSEAKSKMCVGLEEYKGILGKRKSEHAEDHDIQTKKPKFYFEREEHYVVHKLLRELSSASIPSNLPRTTSASLFYRLLSSKTEPRVMQTVGGSSTAGRSRKIVVRDDVSEDQIGKYSHVGSHPFVYIHGAASRASPTKSLKLIELLTTKPLNPQEMNKEDKENKEEAVCREEDKAIKNDGIQTQGNKDTETSADPIRINEAELIVKESEDQSNDEARYNAS